MPGRDVPDLVSQHAGQFRLVGEERQDTARDVDEPAGKRERVDGGLVDHRELPWQARALRELGEPQADAAHVLLQLRIVVDAHLRADLGVRLLAERDLLRFAHQRELALPGHGVRGTGRAQRDTCQGGSELTPPGPPVHTATGWRKASAAAATPAPVGTA